MVDINYSGDGYPSGGRYPSAGGGRSLSPSGGRALLAGGGRFVGPPAPSMTYIKWYIFLL